MTVISMLFLLGAACITILFGYWAWFDRRHYGFSVLGSLIWAFGIAVATGGVFALIALMAHAVH